MMETHHAFSRFVLVGHNDPVVEINIPRLKQIQLDRSPSAWRQVFWRVKMNRKPSSSQLLGFQWVSKYDHWQSIFFQRRRLSTMAFSAGKRSKGTEALNCTR